MLDLTPRPDFLWLLLAASTVAFICRAGGFLLMRFIPASPRLEAALKATPLAVMVGIVAPAVVGAAAAGSMGEMLALMLIIGLSKLGLNDVAIATAGVAVVALMRAYG
jgi:uncharacterized membrane protein